MAIGFAGISSGADWSSIIEQLLEVERAPLDRLQLRETEIKQQISDFGLVKSSIDAFRTAMDGIRTDSGFAPYTGSSSDEDVTTVSADSTAVASSYSVVVTQLASYDKIASTAYADTATAVGTGTLSITVDGDTMNLTVDSSNNTLAGLRDAINNSADNPGVSASILNEAGGSRLILTSDATGASNAINISVTDDDGNNTDAAGLSELFYIGSGGDGYAEQVATAADAELTIDGFDITSASNAVTGAIEGVTLNLVAAGSATIDIVRDDSQIVENAQAFVDAYNGLLDNLESIEGSALEYDSGIRQIAEGVVTILGQSASIDGSDVYLFEAGITRDRYGTVSLDSSELTDALNADFDKIVSLFTDATVGFAQRFYDYADQLLDSGGIVESREEGLDSRMRLVQDQMERQEYRLEIVEKTLIAQFAALDQTVAILQGTSSYLESQLTALLND
jgi:flagellar hook-associated protein 2